ncbi:MAG TPA: hypothetical protein VK424_03190 [Thermoplasmata archaeon]|nr:hypothetical protein [Thermoplasmata archaeon]
MPGAPNRPPEKAPEVPATPLLPEPPERKVLRRLIPSRVTLLLDLWKGAPSVDLLTPYDKAEAAYAQADYATALQALDQLSIRFHEPRWPSLPEPFRLLRVSIPPPQPPSWNPENALPPADREALRARRFADDQVLLARGCIAWAAAHGVAATEWTPKVEEAAKILKSEGLVPGFYERIDPIWEALRDQLPHPKAGATRPSPPAAAPADAGEA